MSQSNAHLPSNLSSNLPSHNVNDFGTDGFEADAFEADSLDVDLNDQVVTGVPAVTLLSADSSSIAPNEDAGLQLAVTIAKAASDRKAADIVILRMTEVSYLADYFVLATGFSHVQVRAISRSIEEKVETELQQYPQRIEGLAEGSWILQDYGDVIAHIFLPREREFYNLEAFWGHAERLEVILD
jgi:ribosome-associated protein